MAVGKKFRSLLKKPQCRLAQSVHSCSRKHVIEVAYIREYTKLFVANRLPSTGDAMSSGAVDKMCLYAVGFLVNHAQAVST